MTPANSDWNFTFKSVQLFSISGDSKQKKQQKSGSMTKTWEGGGGDRN